MTKQEVAKVILGLNYGTLKAIAIDLAAACEDKEARPRMETAEDFAELLFDWAEAYANEQ